MKFPQIGEILEDAVGRRFRVTSVTLWEKDSHDEQPQTTLYVDLEDVKERPPVPDAIRRSLEA